MRASALRLTPLQERSRPQRLLRLSVPVHAGLRRHLRVRSHPLQARPLTPSGSFFMSIGTVIRTDDGLDYAPRRALLQGPNLPPVTYELLRRQKAAQTRPAW
jgi:hypothetical protein